MSGPARIGALVLAAFLFAGAIWAQIGADSKRQAVNHPEIMYLPNQSLLKHFTGGLDSVVADLLWLRCIQYIGFQIKGERSFKWLQSMLDTVVDLDPHFVDAYRYGGMFLAALRADDDAGLDLLHRGMIANPDAWVLPYEAALIYMLNRGEEPNSKVRAAHYVSISAATGNGPDFVTVLAESLQGQFEMADLEREMWQQRLSSNDQLLQQVAARKLIELDIREICAYLNEVNAGLAEEGREPTRNFEDLFRSGAVDRGRMRQWQATARFPEGWPGDYFGGRFFFSSDGQIMNSTLLDNQQNIRLNAIQEALAKYKEQYGAWPDKLETLVVSRFLQTVPPHPYPDRDWVYTAGTGAVRP